MEQQFSDARCSEMTEPIAITLWPLEPRLSIKADKPVVHLTHAPCLGLSILISFIMVGSEGFQWCWSCQTISKCPIPRPFLILTAVRISSSYNDRPCWSYWFKDFFLKWPSVPSGTQLSFKHWKHLWEPLLTGSWRQNFSLSLSHHDETFNCKSHSTT